VKRWLGLLLLLAACGGKKGTLTLKIVVSPINDPFAGAAKVVFTIGDAQHVQTVGVSNGHFNASIEVDPRPTPGPVTLQVYDSANNVIGYGRTPALELQPVDQTVAIWVGRPGTVAPAATALARPLAELAAAYSPGLGLVVAGGRTTDGAVVAEASIYDMLTHSLIPPMPTDPNSSTGGVPPLKNARAGAVTGISQGQNVVVMGGSEASGFGASTNRPTTVAEAYSPDGSYGSWNSLDKPAPVGSYAQATVLGSGNTLVTGGLDENGNPLDIAALLSSGGTTTLNALSTPLAAPRVGHAVAAVTFPEGAGALLVGGVVDGSASPLAERLVGQAFSAYDVPGLENRIGATASALGNTVLVLGGKVNGTAVSSGVLIDVSTTPPGVTAISGALSSPRAQHTANVVNDNVLVCGGVDDKGKNVPSCDLVSGTSFTPTNTMALADGRHGHAAISLDEIGLILLAGGFNDDGQPLPSIEIYTE
jgi:hypothetical protein